MDEVAGGAGEADDSGIDEGVEIVCSGGGDTDTAGVGETDASAGRIVIDSGELDASLDSFAELSSG